MVKEKNLRIIFAQLKPYVWQYKVASALKERGIKTISISLLSFNEHRLKDYFEERISLNLSNLKPKTIFLEFIKNPLNFFKFFYKIFTIKADSAIIQGPPLYLTSFFIKIFKNKFPRIFFSYDILSALYKEPQKDMTKEQIFGEKYSFNNCDAILNKGSIKELELLPNHWMLNKKPSIEFSGYPFSKWFVEDSFKKKISYKEGGIHLVCPATILPNSQSTFIFFPIIRDILKQKIHMHIYPNEKISKKDLKKITLNNNKLERYLHIHRYVSPENLSKEISKYDFGFFFSEFGTNLRQEQKKYALGMKCSSYLEALIPIIIQKDFEFISKDVAKNNLGIIIQDVKNLKAKIKKFDYKKSIKNIKRFREENSTEENINRLIKFVRDLKKKNVK